MWRREVRRRELVERPHTQSRGHGREPAPRDATEEVEDTLERRLEIGLAGRAVERRRGGVEAAQRRTLRGRDRRGRGRARVEISTGDEPPAVAPAVLRLRLELDERRAIVRGAERGEGVADDMREGEKRRSGVEDEVSRAEL